MHLLVELHGQPGWVAALTPLSVDGMIVTAPTTLLADSRAGGRGGFLPWVLLVVGSAASLAANVAVAEPTVAGRIVAAWPSFALIASYELLMSQVRHAAEPPPYGVRPGRSSGRTAGDADWGGSGRVSTREAVPPRRRAVGLDVQSEAWRWAQENLAEDGSLPTGRAIAKQYGRHERWGRLVKSSGLAGELNT
jgi:Protein of unknown function (DUF2637)